MKRAPLLSALCEFHKSGKTTPNVMRLRNCPAAHKSRSDIHGHTVGPGSAHGIMDELRGALPQQPELTTGRRLALYHFIYFPMRAP